MLWTIAYGFIILWFIGMVSAYTMGGLIHILIMFAVITILIQIFKRKKQTIL